MTVEDTGTGPKSNDSTPRYITRAPEVGDGDLTERPAWATNTRSETVGIEEAVTHYVVVTQTPIVTVQLQTFACTEDEDLHHEGPTVVALFQQSDPTFSTPEQLEDLAVALIDAAARLREVQA